MKSDLDTLVKGVAKDFGIVVVVVSISEFRVCPTVVRHLLRAMLKAFSHDVLAERCDFMPNFVEFDREDSHAVPDEPMFSLQKRGLISMNMAAFKALGEPAAVALLYDADEGIIALRKVPRTHHNGYPVRKQGNSRSYLVAATGFTSYHRISTDVSRRYVGRQYDEQVFGFLVAEGIAIKSHRTPKASVHDIREADRPARKTTADQRS